MTLIEKLQPLMDEYTLIKLKIEQLYHTNKAGAGELKAIYELNMEAKEVGDCILDIIYQQNKPIVEEKLKQLTA